MKPSGGTELQEDFLTKNVDKKLLEKRQDKLRAQALTWLTYTEKEAKRVKTLELRKRDLEES